MRIIRPLMALTTMSQKPLSQETREKVKIMALLNLTRRQNETAISLLLGRSSSKSNQNTLKFPVNIFMSQ